MYFLRSQSRKDYSPQNLSCMELSSEDKASIKNVKIILTRLPILENHINHSKTFCWKKDGNIEVKMKNASEFNWKKVYALVVAVLILLTAMICFKDDCQNYGQEVAKRILILPARLNNLHIHIVNAVHDMKNRLSAKIKFYVPLGIKKTLKRKKQKRKNNVCYNDLRDLVLNHLPDVRAADKYIVQRKLSFIEEQCEITKTEPVLAHNFEDSLNSSKKNFNIDSLPDFASYRAGGRILSTPDTEPYDEHEILAPLLQYIPGIKYFSFDQLPICRLSPKLCRYFAAEPSSILKPWTKPGECWSFKGSRGRLEIELSDRIYITAISLEHVPSLVASSTNIRSAPKIFSVIGIDDSEGYKFLSRIHLGTYKYQLTEPNIQTFSLSEELSSHPYKIIEFIVESNHGNPNYTCIYRLRVHGIKA